MEAGEVGCGERGAPGRNVPGGGIWDRLPDRADPFLNPGNGWVSPLCHEPKVALQVLRDMLEPARQDGRLAILYGTTVREVDLKEKFCICISDTDPPLRIQFDYLLDATENGDLLPLAEIPHRTGRESRTETGEPGAAERSEPANVQAISSCFVVEHYAGENHTIQPPESYSYWKDYTPQLDPPWPGKLLSWEAPNPRTMETQTYMFDPHREELGFLSGLWSFRRILDREQFLPGSYASDRCLVNWPMIDYLGGDLLSGDALQGREHIRRAEELSLSFLFWLQTEAARPDGGKGWPGLKLCPAVTGTALGLAKAAYIRESRRIVPLQTIGESDVSATCRPNDTLAERYEDSVGIGYYRIDLHPTTGGDNYIDVPSLPFRIPLKALIPVEGDFILPAAKNIGTTHLTNGCYRLHPVEWNIGESVGALVHHCLTAGVTPQEWAADPSRVRRLQSHLRVTGVELEWPENLNLEDGDPHAHAMK